MEEEVRQREMQEIVAADEMHRVAADRDGDGAVGAGVDRRPAAAPEMDAASCRNAALQLLEGLLVVGEARRLVPGDARRRVLGEVGGQLNLLGEREHVGKEPCLAVDRGIDLLARPHGLRPCRASPTGCRDIL